jgi:hypothetical protein
VDDPEILCLNLDVPCVELPNLPPDHRIPHNPDQAVGSHQSVLLYNPTDDQRVVRFVHSNNDMLLEPRCAKRWQLTGGH